MRNIAIITDTDSSLPQDLASHYGITQVPITIHFGDESYTTGVDIDDYSLFQKVDKINRLPTTAAPAPSAFAKAFQNAFDGGADTVICICVSGKVSTTYHSALSACEQFPGRDIHIVDSEHLSICQGFMAITAAEAAAAGCDTTEIIRATMDIGSRVHVYALLSTLKYLALSGRVGKLAAGMADTFHIKPILTVNDGRLELLQRVRTRKKALQRMLELAQESAGNRLIERAAILHVTAPEEARELQTELEKIVELPQDTIMAEFTPGLSVHTGSGVVGYCLITK